MARRRNKKLGQSRRKPDRLFGSEKVRHLTNTLMLDGKYNKAYRYVCEALNGVADQHFGKEVNDKNRQEKVRELLELLIEQVGPRTEVKSQRFGGATYPVPTQVREGRREALAYRMLVKHARARKGMPIAQALQREMVDALNGTGGAFNEKENILRMAKANIAFAMAR